MRVSLKWLKEMVDLDMSVDELVERLDMTGTAVEAVHSMGESLDGVVIGQVQAKNPHPEADKLTYNQVDVGGPEPLNIVCGATNFEVGDRIPVAVVGAKLPGGIEIKKAKLRGLVSEGMMCSATELQAGADASGIMVLPQDAPVGVPFAQWCGVGDTVLELEVTPNRPDCLSMVGIAREVGAVTGKVAGFELVGPDESGEPASEHVSVVIEDPRLCPRYTARLIRGVRIGPSPDWLAEKVTAAGSRPINNVVDITNFVMYEMGQPLHAFDAATITAGEGGRASVIVRTARSGEDLVTLDGQDRQLTEDTLLICDPSGPIALAGVMGGLATEVTEGTTDILLESATFDPASISRTSRRLGLFSEASSRFERGVDPSLNPMALDRAAALLAELAAGNVAPGIVDAYPRPSECRTLDLRIEKVNAVLGTALSADEVADVLGRLMLDVTAPSGSTTLRVVVPSFRPDLVREIDLVEEVARVHGMDRIPSTLPAGRGRIGGLTSEQKWRRAIGAAMRAAGLHETATYAFIDPRDKDRLGGWDLGPDETWVEITNPMSEEQSVMRWTLLAGLLRQVGHNQRRGVRDVHLYESGTVFVTSEGRKQPKERLAIAGVLAGRWDEQQWWEDKKAAEKDRLGFFDGKGVVETLMQAAGVERWSARAAERPWLQPGRAAEIVAGGEVVGCLGEVSHLALESYDLEAPVTAFEVTLPRLRKVARRSVEYRDVPRFPAVTLDIALMVPEEVTAERVERAIRSAGGKLLSDVRLFDLYQGPGVAAGSKSLAFALAYRAEDRTLTDDEVTPVHEKLVRKVTAAVGGALRR